jgi:hypothetical protein
MPTGNLPSSECPYVILCLAYVDVFSPQRFWLTRFFTGIQWGTSRETTFSVVVCKMVWRRMLKTPSALPDILPWLIHSFPSPFLLCVGLLPFNGFYFCADLSALAPVLMQFDCRHLHIKLFTPRCLPPPHTMFWWGEMVTPISCWALFLALVPE